MNLRRGELYKCVLLKKKKSKCAFLQKWTEVETFF